MLDLIGLSLSGRIGPRQKFRVRLIFLDHARLSRISRAGPDRAEFDSASMKIRLYPKNSIRCGSAQPEKLNSIRPKNVGSIWPHPMD